MTDAIVLDVLLIVLLIAYVVYGFRNGLSRSIFVIAGVVAGAIAAFFVVPLVTGWVAWSLARPVVTIAVTVALVAAGHALGSSLGRGIRRGIERTPLSGLDRLLGAVVTGVAAALVASVVGSTVSQLGVPVLSRATAGSAVLRTINALTPDPVEAWVAQLKSIVADSGLPVISDALGGPAPVIPQLDTGSPQLNAAAQSVVRITGNAFACGVSQSGTGFVVADDRVVTNAHVVAGVTEPVVEAPNGEAIAGSIVYFDPVLDLAIIAVPGLTAAPLPLGGSLPAGTDAAVQGYPFGGPFTSGAARVMQVGTAQVDDIYGTSTHPREVYTLAADVRQGNSGGPVLTLDGTVAGVVFARSADTASVGFAMTMAELDPVAAEASTLTATVSSGDCISD
ncbi:MAG TPA: MarP family serine protease [Rhodoglobus sp.]|mgnify:FL=1|nr:MarP family serine protease [Rhodoglobus sp.]